MWYQSLVALDLGSTSSGELPTWVMMNPSSMFSGVESTCPTTAIDCFDELTRKIWRSGELPTWVMMNPSSMFSGVESTCPTTAIDYFDELTRKIWRRVCLASTVTKHLSTIYPSKESLLFFVYRELMRSRLMEGPSTRITPPSPNYVPGPEYPPSPIDVPYVLEPEYPKYLAPSDAEAPLEDHPLAADASPTALSPGYAADSDLEEDPEEDHTDYPADGGDGNDEPSDDDDDDDDTDYEDEEPFEDKDDDDEEEEHLAPADSLAIPIVDPVPLAGDTETFETGESAPTPRSPQTKRGLPYYSPLPPPRISEIGESSTACAMRQPGTTLEADLRRDKVMETGYEITDTWDEIVEAMLENKESQVRFEDAQDDRAYLRARVNTLFRDRPYHRHTTMILDREAVYARIAWTSSEERSAAIEAHVRTLEAQVATLITQTTSLQTQLTTALGRIATLEARDPEPQDGPAEAGSSC
ncbi:hypothetical protein Tco_0633258 [Tanacetum coccineum]